MKHLKSFKRYSVVNEEFLGLGKVKRFFSGYESEEELQAAKKKFEDDLNEIEKEVKENPEDYVFDKARVEQDAADNKYKGFLDKRVAGRYRDKYYIIYVDGKSGVEKMATGSSKK